ncbi:unnamed protein product [Gadus morhua 'NCC']
MIGCQRNAQTITHTQTHTHAHTHTHMYCPHTNAHTHTNVRSKHTHTRTHTIPDAQHYQDGVPFWPHQVKVNAFDLFDPTPRKKSRRDESRNLIAAQGLSAAARMPVKWKEQVSVTSERTGRTASDTSHGPAASHLP